MSAFFSKKYKSLTPYTPGEQPKKMKYLKLNTNEAPFPPTETAVRYASEAASGLQLYSDPECSLLTAKVAENLGVKPDQVLLTNGSDEILNFAFMAFCDDEHPAAFPDITYGFYKVFAEINNVPYKTIPLTEDFRIRTDDYIGIGHTVFIANPNAPTGIFLSLSEIERIVCGNPDSVVVIDEAYVDFGGESAVSLIDKYKNLLVTRTFSKSRSMAGARLGFGVGQAELIADLNTIKYSTNPYNVNSMTQAAGLGTLEDESIVLENCKKICAAREYTESELSRLGFTLTKSSANFVFARHEKIGGKELYLRLKENGILVRHFDAERISEYNRITVGTIEQMEHFIKTTEKIISGEL